MGQQLFKVQIDIKENTVVDSKTVLSDDVKEDISYFFPLKNSADSSIDRVEVNSDQQISSLQTEYIKEIRNHLFRLTKSVQWEEINTQINEQFITSTMSLVENQIVKLEEEQNNHLTYKQQLQTALEIKLKDGQNRNLSIFAQTSENITDPDQQRTNQLSYFAIQSLTSILLILIKSAEKHDPTIVHQILTLTNQLCEQLPMKCLSSTNSLLFKSLQPLTNFIHQLSLSNDPILSKQTIEIELSFSIAKGSFEDLLPLLKKLIFNTTEVFHVQNLISQMNHYLTNTMDEHGKNKSSDEEKIPEYPSLNYLKSINTFPNTELMKLNEEVFTGQFLSSIILSHIDIDNQINSPSKQSKLSSISCEFQPNTLKDLFHIIEQLTTVSQSNSVISHILTICLRLFTTHLQILSNVKSHLPDLTKYATDDELKHWFELLLKLSCDESSKEIAQEASKGLVNVINIQSSSMTKKLSFIRQYILENKHPILIEQLLIDLNKTETLSNWIDSLCDENEKLMTWEILCSFLDLYLNREGDEKTEIEKIIVSLQSLILSPFICYHGTKTFTVSKLQLSSVIIQYFTYIFQHCITKKCLINDLFNSILIGLCLMTEITKTFLVEDVQPIFLSILPLLAEYYLQNVNHESSEFLVCLIGRMCHVLIIGLPPDPLEIKHVDKFKFPIFAGGCVIDKNDDLLKSNLAIYSHFQLANESEDEKDFLLSIYNNNDDGAELISKLKLFTKDKQRSLQKSIEEQANDACAAIFAVYIKHYRRINLAKSELSRTDQNKPYSQLLSLYEYANRIQSLFATIKGQGGDCNELYKQIKMRTLFLLLSVKENDCIPIIKEGFPTIVGDIKPKSGFDFQRQRSRWSKAKHILTLLKNLFQACIRFKKFLLEKKQMTEIKCDYESVLNRSIENFVYGDFYKSSTSITNEEKQVEIEELEKCLHRQHQRAMIRLITYQFIQAFIQKNEQNPGILPIFLPYLRKSDLDWSYFDDIQASNTQLKNQISNSYYSIIKLIFPLPNLAPNIFSLLNLSYESIDILHFHDHQLIEPLFISFVSLITNPSVDYKFVAFNWFRLFVFKFCEHIEIEKVRKTFNPIFQQIQKLVFNNLIFNEIKSFKVDSSSEEKRNSLKNLSLNWFIQTNQSNELYINQYLAFLLRSMYFYRDVASICATIDYLEELIDIYHHHQSNITRLLVIKLLRYLIPYIPDDIDGKAKNLTEKCLMDVLNTIGEKSTAQEIRGELIYMYRTIMAINSSWQFIATEFVQNSIKSHLNVKSIETNDTNEMNKLFASLCIMGGDIECYRLGSIVKIESNDESSLAVIIEINADQTEKPYIIQYLQTNQIESVSIDKLRLKIDVLPPNANESILDAFGDFIQIDTSTNESLMLLQLKRHSIAVLSHLLNNKNLIDIFLNKPYASILAQLCRSNLFPTDLRVFNQQHLEQYSLSLNRCEIIEEEDKDVSIPINDQENPSSTTWNVNKVQRNQTIVDALSIPINGWKPYASEGEMDDFKQGRIGNEDMSIVPMPRKSVTAQAIEECGTKHRFHGRLTPTYDNTNESFPTFIIDNLQLSKGKWYYCVRLPVGDIVQIGWATNGFSPGNNRGVGDDKYSWSYDGSRGVFFYVEGFYGQYDDIRWKANDVCGCGIEIDGKNTNIKYWLNGKLLGTAFAHDCDIPSSSSTKCNLLPNGPATIYYPSVSVQRSTDIVTCEVIVSPEDMKDCPLPDGYKPLLLPKSVQTENSIVDYPSNAYLIGDNPQESYVPRRMNSTTNVLRDFVNEDHLETTFHLDDDYLSLPDKSDGFLLSFDADKTSSMTISLDFQIISTAEELDFSLLKFHSTTISWKKTDEKQRCVIIFLFKEQQIQVYLNDEYRLFHHNETTINQFDLHLLPGISARIQNLAVWKYALPTEQISRLFTYGLFYIVNDYQQRKEYRKRVNTISFSKSQQVFTDESLLPFNEPFSEDIWEKTKKQADEDESKYFKSHDDGDYSTVELFGNQTYLILNKPNEEWSNYTFVLDLSIPQWPITTEKLTLITFNSKSKLYLTEDGQLCLDNEESKPTIVPNEYFRLLISVDKQSIRIYLNDKLQIDIKVDDDRFHIKSNRIDLFKETNLTENTTDQNTLRVSLKSLSYLNRSITIDQLQSPTLIAPPLEMLAPSLIAMGYKKHWIQSVMEHNKTEDIPTILHERKEQFIQIDQENERNRYLKIFSRLNPSINSEVFNDLINSSTFDTNEHLIDLASRLFTHLISSPSIDSPLSKIEFEDNWFSQSVQDFDIPQTIIEWIRDDQSSTEDEDHTYQLLPSNPSTTKKTPKSLQYSHPNLSSQQYSKSRIACEHGLMAIYARSTILNMIKVWSDGGSTLFPLEKLGDYTLLKLLDDTEDEKTDRISLLIKSILKREMKQLLEHINNEELPNKAPLFYYLQKDVIIQSIQFLLKPSLVNQNSNEEIMTDEQQLNFNFVLKILNLFGELLSEKSLIKQHQIDLIIPIVFPTSLINLSFHLFLLTPSHQSKISILHLFTTLLRISDSFILNNPIQQFFFQFLIDLSSNSLPIPNSSKKKVQVPLTDLIYILLTKENNQLKDYQSKLPESIRDLFTMIDVIHAWTDLTKQKSLPETILEQSTEYLSDELKLTQANFQKSNIHFNLIADQELINLMNNSSSNSSFSSFIQTLPTESEPNPTFYKTSVTLANIPADCIQIRARFIFLLNRAIETNLSTVDFSLSSEQSFLTDQIRTIKFYLLSVMKFQFFHESLEKTETNNTDDWCIVNFDTVKASTDTENSESTMFYQAYQQLHANAHLTFRQPNEQLWRAQYLEMHSTDQGGPYRDSITRMCWDICSTRLSLFILCPNGRTNAGFNRDCWIPNVFSPNKSIPNKIRKQYRFVGQLLGMAIRKKHYLELKFPSLFWKKLLNEEIRIEDIEGIDLHSFTMINEMEKNIEQIQSIGGDQDMDSLFSSIMSELRFDVISSSGETYELISGGRDIPITAANFKQYCSSYRQYRLNEFNRQIDLIRQGLYSVIPSYYLSLFTANELEEAVCGKGRIDTEILKRNTNYGGDYSSNSPAIERFWTVMNEMFTDEQKKLFLIFVWGRSTLPTRDEDFQYKFTICTFDVYDGEVDKTLPRSHTCFFAIDLPAYSTTDIMYERLNYAITCCSSIDGDGNMNDGPPAGFVDFDDSLNEL